MPRVQGGLSSLAGASSLGCASAMFRPARVRPRAMCKGKQEAGVVGAIEWRDVSATTLNEGSSDCTILRANRELCRGCTSIRCVTSRNQARSWQTERATERNVLGTKSGHHLSGRPLRTLCARARTSPRARASAGPHR